MESIIPLVISPLLNYYIPIDDLTLKMSLIIPLSQLLGLLINSIYKNIFNYNLFKWFMRDKYILIENSHPSYEKLLDYYYKKFPDKFKACKLQTKYGKNTYIIEQLSHNYLIDKYNGTNIYIKFVSASSISTAASTSASDSKDNMRHSNSNKTILISTTSSLNVIEEYIENLIKECNSKTCNKIPIYTIASEGKKNNKYMEWVCKKIKMSKNINNTIVSEEVNEHFYQDIHKFINDEEYYINMGLPYKRGYLLYGVAGTGKTSLIKAISNEYHLPIFILDLSIVSSNNELVKMINEINQCITVDQKYLLIFEDIDRSNVFNNNWKKSDAITDDCLLNILDGIDESYGRIVVMTCNNIEKLKKLKAMIRPGRIDKVIEIKLCTFEQINNMLKFYFPNYEFNIKNEVNITPAILTQMILIFNDPGKIEQFINTHLDFTKKDLTDLMKHEMISPISTIKNNTEGEDKNIINKNNTHKDENDTDWWYSKERQIQKQLITLNKLLLDIEQTSSSIDILNEQKKLELEAKKVRARLLEISINKSRSDIMLKNAFEKINIKRSDIGLKKIIEETDDLRQVKRKQNRRIAKRKNNLSSSV
jgi:SpoVK/Ycf46/Vps4 family AAA+-type ATPase